MKKIILYSLFALGLSTTSCVEHEVIPAPTPKVNTSANFKGTINMTDIELTRNVNGYNATSDKFLLMSPAPLPSSVIYMSELKSNTSTSAVRMKLGSITWDGSVSAEPSLSMFNSFMTNNLNPPYKTGGVNGFEFSYTDAYGVTWTSKENDPNQNIVIQDVKTASDASGDYALFTVKFNCQVYHTFYKDTYDPYTGTLIPQDIERGILVENAVYNTWFRK